MGFKESRVVWLRQGLFLQPRNVLCTANEPRDTVHGHLLRAEHRHIMDVCGASSADGKLTAGCQRRELESLCKFRFPLEASHSFGVIYPFPSPFVPLKPVLLEANDLHLVKVVRRRGGWYRDDVSSDVSAYARFFKGLSRGCSLKLHIRRLPSAFWQDPFIWPFATGDDHNFPSSSCNWNSTTDNSGCCTAFCAHG